MTPHHPPSIEAALNLWIEITGIDPNKDRIVMAGSLDWDVHKINESLRDALLYDTSEVTAYLLLRTALESYAGSRTFTVRTILNDYDALLSYLGKVERLEKMVTAPEIAQLGDRFRNDLLKAMAHYGAGARQDIVDLIKDDAKLAFLRRDAFKSLNKLRLHQFTTGERVNEKPQYHKSVHIFWNIHSVIARARQMPSGVFLALVKDPRDLASYFAFVIRNGENVFVLTDKPEYAHPLQKHMRRMPERSFGARTAQNWFPYSLLNYRHDEDQGEFLKNETTAIVPINVDAVPIKAIKELDAPEVVWVSMMFSLIVERFWKMEFNAPTLSYTGQQISSTQAQQARSKGDDTQLPAAIADLPVVQMERPTRETLTAENLADMDWKSCGLNTWLEERFRDQVNDEYLALESGVGEGRHYITPDNDALQHVPADENEPVVVRKKKYDIRSFGLTEFGTEEELSRNRRFLARHNMAQQIQRLADKEFENTRDDVEKWVAKAIARNAPALLAAIASGEFKAQLSADQAACCGLSRTDGNRQPLRHVGNILRMGPKTEFQDHFGPKWFSYGGFTWSSGFDRDYLCALNEAKASICARFEPRTAEALATLCGVAVEQLPEVLQNWAPKKDHRANHILDVVDPMDWVVNDPWTKFDPSLSIYLSKSGLNKIRKGGVKKLDGDIQTYCQRMRGRQW